MSTISATLTVTAQAIWVLIVNKSAAVVSRSILFLHFSSKGVWVGTKLADGEVVPHGRNRQATKHITLFHFANSVNRLPSDLRAAQLYAPLLNFVIHNEILVAPLRDDVSRPGGRLTPLLFSSHTRDTTVAPPFRVP